MDSRIYSEKTLASIKSHLEKNESKFITYPKFIFLCGKAIDGQYEKTNRGILQNYLQKQSEDIFIVLSERPTTIHTGAALNRKVRTRPHNVGRTANET